MTAGESAPYVTVATRVVGLRANLKTACAEALVAMKLGPTWSVPEWLELRQETNLPPLSDGELCELVAETAGMMGVRLHDPVKEGEDG